MSKNKIKKEIKRLMANKDMWGLHELEADAKRHEKALERKQSKSRITNHK